MAGAVQSWRLSIEKIRHSCQEGVTRLAALGGGAFRDNPLARHPRQIDQIPSRRYEDRAKQIRADLDTGLQSSSLSSAQLLGLSMSCSELVEPGGDRVDVICEAIKRLVPAFKAAYRAQLFKDDFEYATVRMQALVSSAALDALDEECVDLSNPAMTESLRAQMRKIVNLACPRNLSLRVEELNRVAVLADLLTDKLVEYNTAVYYRGFVDRITAGLCSVDARSEWGSESGRVRLLKGFMDEIEVVSKRAEFEKIGREMEQTANRAIAVALVRARAHFAQLSRVASSASAGRASVADASSAASPDAVSQAGVVDYDRTGAAGVEACAADGVAADGLAAVEACAADGVAADGLASGHAASGHAALARLDKVSIPRPGEITIRSVCRPPSSLDSAHFKGAHFKDASVLGGRLKGSRLKGSGLSGSGPTAEGEAGNGTGAGTGFGIAR